MCTALFETHGCGVSKAILENEVQSKVRNDLDQQQREYFLHQQMKTIQEELGGASSHQDVSDMKTRSLKRNGVKM